MLPILAHPAVLTASALPSITQFVMAHVLLVDDFMCAMSCLGPIIIQIAIVCCFLGSPV